MAGIPITLNFDLQAPLPLDSRLLVANTNQLNSINPKYSGMIVYAANTQKLYYLEDLNTNTWSQIGTGSFVGGGSLNNVVYTSGDQIISGSKTFLTTGVYYSGGFYRYDKDSRTIFEDNVFINKINDQTSFGIYNHYFLNKNLPISSQLFDLPLGIRTGNIVNLFFNNSGINNSIENNILVEPTVMIRYTGNSFPNNIIPILGHSSYNNRALKKINYNGITENVVYTTGDQSISGAKNFRSRPTVNGTGVLLSGEIPRLPETIVYTSGSQLISGNKTFRDLTAFKQILAQNQNWALDNTILGKSITGRWGFSGNFPGPYVDTFDPTGSYYIGDNLYLNKDGDIIVLGGTFDNTSASFSRAVYILKTGANNTWEVMQSITGRLATSDSSRRLPVGRVFEMSEDNSVLLVGQDLGFYDEDINIRCGEVHIFTGSKQNGWNKKQTIVGNIRSFENFGASLAISKNANTIIVGSPAFDSPPANATGNVHIFTGNKDIGWSLKQRIIGNSSELNFGGTVSCNHDASIIAVGGAFALSSYGTMSRTGYAYVYTGSPSTNWNIQQKISGVYENDDYNWGTLWFGNGIKINESGNVLMISDPRKKEARGTLYFYTGSNNSPWLKTSEITSPLPYSVLGRVTCNHDASIVLASCIGFSTNQSQSYSLVMTKSVDDYNWSIQQQVIYNNPPINLWYLGDGMGMNKWGDIFVLGTHDSWSGALQPQNNTKGMVAVFKDLEPNEFSVGNTFPESFVKIKGSTKIIGNTNISGDIKLYTLYNRPTIDDKRILISGEAIPPDSNARLWSLAFKNFYDFALEGPSLRSVYEGSGVPASLGIWGSDRISEFTDSGVRFYHRPEVNGTGVLLQGEATIGGASDSFDGDRSITLNVPGFKNLNVGGDTISGFLNNLFFPFVPATISLNAYPLQELGTTYSQIPFNGTITQNSETQITTLQYMLEDTVLNTVTSPSFGNFSTSFTLNLINNATVRARVSTNNNGSPTIITGSQYISFIAPSWYGVGGNGIITGVKNMTKYLNTKGNRTFTFNTNNNHFYYAYPNDWGLLSSIIDQNGFNITLSFSSVTGNVLLENSANYNYRIYQSINPSTNSNFNITFNF